MPPLVFGWASAGEPLPPPRPRPPQPRPPPRPRACLPSPRPRPPPRDDSRRGPRPRRQWLDPWHRSLAQHQRQQNLFKPPSALAGVAWRPVSVSAGSRGSSTLPVSPAWSKEPALLRNSVGSIGNESLGRRGERIVLGCRGGSGTERGILKLGKASVGHGRVRGGGGLGDSLGDLSAGAILGGLLHITI